jgi:RNA polymerase sigma factor (TIGR02999 family)
MTKVSGILSAIVGGDERAAAELLPLVYDALRKLAARKLAGEKAGHSLQPTALVHEAYLRLVGSEGNRFFKDHRHFFAAAAIAMRRILVDHARKKSALKRGRSAPGEDLESLPGPEANENLIVLDEALEKLARHDEPKARLVELRYFGGLTGEEAAAVLGISATTADRYWTYARAWLKVEMSRS